jgi:hypothetical protein
MTMKMNVRDWVSAATHGCYQACCFAARLLLMTVGLQRDHGLRQAMVALSTMMNTACAKLQRLLVDWRTHRAACARVASFEPHEVQAEGEESEHSRLDEDQDSSV